MFSTTAGLLKNCLRQKMRTHPLIRADTSRVLLRLLTRSLISVILLRAQHILVISLPSYADEKRECRGGLSGVLCEDLASGRHANMFMDDAHILSPKNNHEKPSQSV